MKLSKKFTTVTPLSKALALAMFVLFPFIGFYLGISYQKRLDTPFVLQSGKPEPTGVCKPPNILKAKQG